jgi:GNAT superfamily N-acetyltransferase
MAKTLDELGIPISIVKDLGPGPFKGSSIITVTCACGAEAALQIGSVLRTIRRVGNYRCLSCGMKAKHQDDDYRRKHSDGVKKSWSEDRRQNQSNISKALWDDPNFRDKITEASSEAWKDPARLEEASKRTASLWQDATFLAKQDEANEARSAKSTALVRSLWARPDYRQRQLVVKRSDDHVALQKAMAVERWKDPEYRSLVCDGLNDYFSDPAVRKQWADKAIQTWRDPEYRRKQEIANASPELRKLKADNARKQWENPETRQRIADGLAQYGHGAKDSILERVAQNVLSALQVEYVRHHVVGYFEFDLFIPSHGILVECNGEYWHSLRQSQDAAKFTYVDEYFPEYKILYLWERDFLNPAVIHQKLVRALCLESTRQEAKDFNLSDVSIRKLDPKVVEEGSYYSSCVEFLQSFHYAGFGRSAKTVYGAYLGDVLIGVCKFSPPVRAEVATSMGFTSSQVLELDRFCIHPNYQKKNLASWLISRCVKMAFETFLGVGTLVSFADSTLGHLGTIYKAANWKQVHVVPPDYHYISPDGFVVHKKTLYDHASRNGSKEAEYAAKFGYVKAFGKSKIKFRLDR